MGLRKVCAQTVHLPKLWSDTTMAQLRGLIMAAEAQPPPAWEAGLFLTDIRESRGARQFVRGQGGDSVTV